MSALPNETYTYGKKIHQILKLFDEGRSRDEIASIMGYSNYRSMDVILRRKGFQWDPSLGKYVQADSETGHSHTSAKAKEYIPLMPSRIIDDFNTDNPDPLTIAKKNGFNSHLELAEYMKSKGFIWDPEIGNYVLKDNPSAPAQNAKQTEDQEQSTEQIDDKSLKEFLIYLKKNEDKIKQLLDTYEPDGEIPRYTLPGRYINKSIYISDALEDVVNTFSKEKNLKQKEIFEIALIQFFRRYGYKEEVNRLLSAR